MHIVIMEEKSKANFKVKVGEKEISLEGSEEKIFEYYEKAFNWATSTSEPVKTTNLADGEQEVEKPQKEDKRGGKRTATLSPVLDEIINSNFMKIPQKKDMDQILSEFKNKGYPSTGKKVRDTVRTALNYRLKSGKIKGTEEDGKWVYWTV